MGSVISSELCSRVVKNIFPDSSGCFGIERTTPCLFASFSIITLIAVKTAQEKKEKIPIQKTSWYQKSHITFSDMLCSVRLALLRRKYFSKFGLKPDLGKKALEDLILRAAAA